MIFALSIVVLDWILRTIYVTLAIPIFLLLFRYRYLSPAEKWFLLAVVAHFTTAISSEMLYRSNVNPNYAGSVYYIVVVVIYIGFFCSAMDLKQHRRLLYGIAAAHMMFSFSNLMWLQKETLNTYSAISLSVIIISLSLLFFYRLLKKLPTENLLTLPVFWFITSEFITNTGQMLMKSFAHFLINIFNDNLIILWVFHHGLGIVGNLISTYGAWLVFIRYKNGGEIRS